MFLALAFLSCFCYVIGDRNNETCISNEKQSKTYLILAYVFGALTCVVLLLICDAITFLAFRLDKLQQRRRKRKMKKQSTTLRPLVLGKMDIQTTDRDVESQFLNNVKKSKYRVASAQTKKAAKVSKPAKPSIDDSSCSFGNIPIMPESSEELMPVVTSTRSEMMSMFETKPKEQTNKNGLSTVFGPISGLRSSRTRSPK